MGYSGLLFIGMLGVLALVQRLYKKWRQRQDDYARAELYGNADRPFEFAFGASSPDRRAGDSERLLGLETPTTAKSTALAAAAGSASSSACGSTGAKRWHKDALADVQTTQSLIKAALEDDDEEEAAWEARGGAASRRT